MRVLGIDFETQSLDAEKTFATEVGAVTVEVQDRPGKGNVYFPVASYQAYMYEPSYPPQPELIVDLTGITDATLKEHGINPAIALSDVIRQMETADIVMAHNKAFDQAVFEARCKHYGVAFPKKEWICTRSDIDYPKKFTCKKLGHLALDHGLKMDNRALHRAVNDVDLMLELVLENYKLPEILAFAREPWVYLHADILPPWKDGGVGKKQATDIGYGWETPKGDYGPKFPGHWVKKCKQKDLDKEKELAPFRVGVLKA